MLENGDKETTARFLADLSIKVLNAINAVKDGKSWHAVNKLTGVQQKILDELGVLTGKNNENTDNTPVQVTEDGGS